MEKSIKYLASVSYTDDENLKVLKITVITGAERLKALAEFPPHKYRILHMYGRTRLHDTKAGVITRYRDFSCRQDFPPVAEISAWLNHLKIVKDANDA